MCVVPTQLVSHSACLHIMHRTGHVQPLHNSCYMELQCISGVCDNQSVRTQVQVPTQCQDWARTMLCHHNYIEPLTLVAPGSCSAQPPLADTFVLVIKDETSIKHCIKNNLSHQVRQIQLYEWHTPNDRCPASNKTRTASTRHSENHKVPQFTGL